MAHSALYDDALGLPVMLVMYAPIEFPEKKRE